MTAPRLLLREFTEDDLSLLLDLNADPEVMRYLPGRVATLEENQRALENTLFLTKIRMN